MPAFESAILPKRKRLSLETEKLFCQLYLEGLLCGAFEPVFRQLLGETAPLSANTILRLKEEWEQEYEAWRQRSLELEMQYSAKSACGSLMRLISMRGTESSSTSLVLRYGWQSLTAYLLGSVVFVLLGVAGLAWALTLPSDAAVVYVFSALFIGLGLIGLLNYVIPASRHWVALGIDTSGITVKPGPILGRRAKWGRVPNRVIPWEDVFAVRVGKLTVEALGGMYGDFPMTYKVPMIAIWLVGGPQVLKDLQGVRYDRREIAAAIATLAPHVKYSEGEVYPK